jgi:preprotein translocase subunit SecY
LGEQITERGVGNGISLIILPALLRVFHLRSRRLSSLSGKVS